MLIYTWIMLFFVIITNLITVIDKTHKNEPITGVILIGMLIIIPYIYIIFLL